MATGVGGTNYSWRALEPYPIESELAKTAMGSPQGAVSAVSAASLLQGYQADRQLAQADYAQDIQSQQQFQRQQLAAQMADNQAKAVIEAGKAGMLPMFHGMYAGVPGADEDAFNYTAGQLDAAQRAKTLQESGTAFNQFAQGGFQSPDIPGSVGISGTMTDPALVRAAQIRAAAQLAGDRLKAAASGQPSTSVTEGAAGTPPQVHHTYSGKMSDAQINASRAKSGLPPIPTSLTPQVPYEQPGGSGGGSGGGGGGATSLPMAPATNAPAGLPPGSVQLNTASKDGAAAQVAAQQATENLKRNGDPRYAQLQRRGTTVFDAYKSKDGSTWVRGNDNRAYQVQ